MDHYVSGVYLKACLSCSNSMQIDMLEDSDTPRCSDNKNENVVTTTLMIYYF